MSSEESEWVNVSFDFKFLGADMDWEEIDEKHLLLGMGKAIAYLVLSDDLTEEEFKAIKVYVRNFSMNETEFLTDEQLDRVMRDFELGEGEEP